EAQPAPSGSETRPFGGSTGPTAGTVGGNVSGRVGGGVSASGNLPAVANPAAPGTTGAPGTGTGSGTAPGTTGSGVVAPLPGVPFQPGATSGVPTAQPDLGQRPRLPGVMATPQAPV